STARSTPRWNAICAPSRSRPKRCSITSMRSCPGRWPNSAPPRPPAGERTMPEVTLVGAVTMALARAMADDERVVVLGEDVGVNGGVFRATQGLLERFGRERVIDTPLAELAIGGVAVGMAAAGLKPVAEIQFSGFIYPTIDQIVSHASRLRNRTRGRLTCPMVL